MAGEPKSLDRPVLRHYYSLVRYEEEQFAMPCAVAVIRDLMFATRVNGAGKDLGVPVQIVSTSEGVAEKLDAGPVGVVLVDMNLPPDDVRGAIEVAARHASRPKVVAFYSHVDTALRDAALGAGATEAMPRSRFVVELPRLLRACAPAESDSNAARS